MHNYGTTVDCAINEKCCSVDGERGICSLFPSPPWGIWQLKSLLPQEFAIQGKQNAYARESPRGEGWAQLELTDTCWTQNIGKVLNKSNYTSRISDFVSTGLDEYV